jgi:hypothetical protein
MIHYHGGPITPATVAMKCWRRRHAFVSFAVPAQVSIAAEVSQSFALDNGAFSVWKAGRIVDWSLYYRWAEIWLSHPACDFALIPDVIDGTEDDNDTLVALWPLGTGGVPVWHLHESLERLESLCTRWPRVALGSSGDYAVIGTQAWWHRIGEAMSACCNEDGTPKTKLHGLRMLDPKIIQYIPFSSADSTNVARNIGVDSAWNGTYTPASKETRALVIAERMEQHNAPAFWTPLPVQPSIFARNKPVAKRTRSR